jgi:hypothetical protein
MADDYAHPVGQASATLIEGGVRLMEQADAAFKNNEHSKAVRLNEEAAQHMVAANVLDALDADYRRRNSV